MKRQMDDRSFSTIDMMTHLDYPRLQHYTSGVHGTVKNAFHGGGLPEHVKSHHDKQHHLYASSDTRYHPSTTRIMCETYKTRRTGKTPQQRGNSKTSKSSRFPQRELSRPGDRHLAGLRTHEHTSTGLAV